MIKLKDIITEAVKDKKGFIGIVSNGTVYGYGGDTMVPNVFHVNHSQIEYGNNNGRFRYIYSSKTVLWNKFPPTDEERTAVEEWLHKRGMEVSGHRDAFVYSDSPEFYLPPILTESVLLTESLRGEWWIDDSGQALFADGDVGDMNHEAYVVDRLKREIMTDVGVDTDDEFIGNFEQYKDEIFQNIGHEFNADELELWNDEIYENPVVSYIKRTSPEIFEKVNYAYGRGDAREYAMKKWGWARVVRNNIQIQILTPDILKHIVEGLWDAYRDELENHDGDRVSDTNLEGEHTFNLEVLSTRSLYEDVPLSVLEKRNPTALNAYRKRYE